MYFSFMVLIYQQVIMKLNKQIESIITVVESLKESQVQLFEKGLFLHHKNRSKMGDTVYESPTSI